MKIAFLILSSALISFILVGQSVQNPDPTRFQSEINNFISWDAKNSFPDSAILFAGSSSIRMWQTHDDFPDFKVINRGFGGAHISDMIYYFHDIVEKYQPELIVFYCGDNDIDFGKSAERTFADFKAFMGLVENLKSTPSLIYIPAKPSPARWFKYPEMKRLNSMIAEYSHENNEVSYVEIADPMLNDQGRPRGELFRSDSLHLDVAGYKLWNQLVEPVILEAIHQK